MCDFATEKCTKQEQISDDFFYHVKSPETQKTSDFSGLLWYTGYMEIKSFSEQELNNLSKDMIIALYMQLSTSFQLLSQQNEQILDQNKAMSLQIENLQENIAILINHRFGRQTEKTKEIFDGQMFFTTNDNGDLILNEAETLFDTDPEEDERSEEELLEELKKRLESRKRKKDVRQEDLRMAKVIPTDYTIPEERLNELFPEGYKELAVKVTRTVEYTPAELVVHEEHIHQYKSIKGDVFVTADHPSHLLDHSILSPSLAAKMINDKFINAVPINRISREFGWLDVVIRPQTMSRWLIKIVDKYFKPVIGRMEYRMINSAKLIHCDETPFVCEQDRKKPGKSKNSKSYMWVYHTADQYGSPPIFIYQYKDNRRTENVESFLKNPARFRNCGHFTLVARRPCIASFLHAVNGRQERVFDGECQLLVIPADELESLRIGGLFHRRQDVQCE